ncbi:MAG: hypothetical protein V1922_02305 [bacterium]
MVKLIPLEKRKKIKVLRQKGYSLPEIAKELEIGRASVFRYIQGVAILPKYINEWHGKQGGSIKRMKIKEKLAQEKAQKTITSLTEKEKLLFISALYWGEGGKTDFNFTNTDSELIRVFINGLQNILRISKNRLRVSIRIYEDLDKKKCLEFWSSITGIPINEFVNVNILKGKKIGKLSYGMCRIRITKGGDMLKYIKAIYRRAAALYSPHSSSG